MTSPSAGGPLDGRVSVVTGAARGLGAGIAWALAARGARLVCVDVADASQTASEIKAAWPGSQATSAVVDVSDRENVHAAWQAVVSEFGRLDVLVNNAGLVQAFAPLQDLPDAAISRILAVNLHGTMICSAEAIPLLPDGSGRIINMASQYGKLGRPGYAAYSATKAGVVGLTQSLALELAPRGITVNCICPGTMLTEMVRETFDQRASASSHQATGEALMDAFPREHIPLARIGTPEDVGAMVAWIASDEASFTTGAAFNVTGGETIF